MAEHLPLGARFSIIGRSFKKELDAILSREDITGVQFGVLLAVCDYEHADGIQISQKMLEEAVHVTHPTMNEILKKLTAKGFIECRTAENDRRRKCISSTAKARDLVFRMEKTDDEVWAKLSECLSEQQRELLVELIGIMVDNICNCKNTKGVNSEC